MTDIVERLRKVPQRVKEGFLIFWSHDYPLCREAADTIEALRAENARLLKLLDEALEGYEDCISYKSEYLVEKHGDREEVARIRKAMGESDE